MHNSEALANYSQFVPLLPFYSVDIKTSVAKMALFQDFPVGGGMCN